MRVTAHALVRFRERFPERKMAQEDEEVLRAYLLRLLERAKEIVPVEPTDTVHKVSRRIVFVIKDQKVVTVFRFKQENYKPKRDRFRYNNNSSRKRRSYGDWHGH